MEFLGTYQRAVVMNLDTMTTDFNLHLVPYYCYSNIQWAAHAVDSTQDWYFTVLAYLFHDYRDTV